MPLLHPTGADEVVVRGKNFTKDAPLQFSELEPAPTSPYFLTRETYGFRVVLELPEP